MTASAVAVALLALAALVGWHAGRAGLVRGGPGVPPMQYTAALSLGALAVALLVLPTRLRRWALPAAVAGVVVGGLTLAEYGTGRELLLGRLVPDPFVAVGRFPRRMSPNTAVCVVLLGTGFAAAAARLRWARVLVAVFGSIATAIALLALFGYGADAPTAYTWGTATAMAPTTAAGVLGLACGGLVLAWYEDERPPGTTPSWLPLPVGIGTFALTGFTWQAIAAVDRRGAGRAIDPDAAARGVLAVGVVVSVLVAIAVYGLQLAQRHRLALAEGNERLRERSELDRLVLEAYSGVAAAPDVAAGLAELLRFAQTVVPIDRAGYSVAEPDGEAARLVAIVGAEGGRMPPGTLIPLTGRHEAAAAGRTITVRDAYAADAEDDALAALLRSRGLCSTVVVPTAARGKVVALTSFSSAGAGAFDDDAVAALEALARGCSGVLAVLHAVDQERATSARLRELDAMKNEFVGIVAHDLRSPMTVITGYVDMVLHRWGELSDESKRELLETASRNTKRLSVLVEDVLQVARLESGDFPFEIRPFDLGALVRRTAAEMQSRTPDPITVVVQPDLPPALGDEDRQWRVLTNLLSNAQKYAPGPVDVHVRSDGTHAVVRVVDHGPGIAPDQVGRIFDKFSRVPSAATKEKGTGLGLYICRSLVEAQGGRIEVDSTVGEGTTFTYTVPLA